MAEYTWLPKPLKFEEYDNDQSRITDAAYAIFRNDFIDSFPECLEKKVIPNPNLRPDGREECFWHIISQEYQKTRVFNVNRCEHINWSRTIIENLGNNDVIHWKSHHRRSKAGKKDWRLKIAISNFSYLIILRELATSFILITAYPVMDVHTITKLYHEYQNAVNLT